MSLNMVRIVTVIYQFDWFQGAQRATLARQMDTWRLKSFIAVRPLSRPVA